MGCFEWETFADCIVFSMFFVTDELPAKPINWWQVILSQIASLFTLSASRKQSVRVLSMTAMPPRIQIQGLNDSVDWNQKLDLPFVNDVWAHFPTWRSTNTRGIYSLGGSEKANARKHGGFNVKASAIVSRLASGNQSWPIAWKSPWKLEVKRWESHLWGLSSQPCLMKRVIYEA